MSKQKVKVPDSLRDILLEFSIAYLLEQPGDVIDFAVDFFTKLQTNRAQTGIDIDVTKASTPDDTASQDDGELFFPAKKLWFPLFKWIMNGSGEPKPPPVVRKDRWKCLIRNSIKFSFSEPEPPVNRFAAGRRKSVFAEQYDPEEDEEEEANKVIFPKTDEQRQRLCDSVKNILLFRSLDIEQVR